MTCDWQMVRLGSTGLRVNPLGVSASYGVGTKDLEAAFERGINYFFWGSARRAAFADAIVAIAQKGKRDELVVAIESYSRVGSLVGPSVDAALRRLRIEYADVLILGWWNRMPPERIVEAAVRQKDAGKIKHIMVSCHDRPTFARFIADSRIDAIMVRYNAAHAGAEVEVFPLLEKRRPGVVAFTATRWGALVNPEYTPKNEPVPRGSDCYRFVLSSPHVDVCASGPKDGAELKEAMAALDRGPLSPDEMAWMRRVGAHVHARRPPRPGGRLMDLLDRVATLGGA